MVVSRRWLEFRSIKKVVNYLLAKNGGYEYLSEKSILTSFVEPVYYFCKFLGYSNPDDLIKDIKDGKINVEDAIADWRLYLVERGRAPSSVRRYNNGLKRWLEVNRVQVDWDDINISVPLPKRRDVVEDRIPTRDELRRLVNIANMRMKALIEVAVSSGLRIGAIINLKLDDVDFKRDPTIAVIRVRPEISKNKVGYYSLISSEAREVLLKYLKSRSVESIWLFPSYKDPSKPMPYNAVNLAWSRLLKKAGLDEKSRKGGFYKLHIHTLRKYFRTMLEGYLTKSEIMRLMGHLRKEYLDGSYFKPIEDELITKYKNAMHRLMILTEADIEDIRKKTLLDMAKLLGFEDEKIKKIELLLQKKTVDEVLEDLRRLKEL